jgi:hypothetical protein
MIVAVRATHNCNTNATVMAGAMTFSATVMGTFENSEFAQMQGAEKISPRRIYIICKQEIFFATQQLG